MNIKVRPLPVDYFGELQANKNTHKAFQRKHKQGKFAKGKTKKTR